MLARNRKFADLPLEGTGVLGRCCRPQQQRHLLDAEHRRYPPWRSFEEHDIFGDGVNVAERLQGLAEPGRICVSGVLDDTPAVLGDLRV